MYIDTSLNIGNYIIHLKVEKGECSQMIYTKYNDKYYSYYITYLPTII